MFNIGPKIFLLFLLAFPITLVSIGGVTADSDPSEDHSPDSVVEEEEDDEDEVLVEEAQVSESDTEDDLDEDSTGTDVTSHPDADTTIVFVTGEEFPANEIVKFLVGFTNKGSQDFTVQSLEASFRYPQDYQFYIQNFTALPLSTLVPPQRQASFEYSFIPAQPMAGRPFGLVILLTYQDSEGNGFQSAIYNQTVTITELDEGLDGETMFLYVFLSGLVALLLFGLYQGLEARTRKRLPVKVETGTSGLNDVDISWIPQETLNVMNKASPKASPRKRTKRAAGTDQ
ncbi:translocon-associated protein subunit alpha-like [Conger conger]|uniref:translocon-associated protein subunit alpha-like n=1 Tax=Conger conger TaxID=82655 RepID=UPI002A5AC40D|nr:translocon-associated protein subunit alpha-like [Conger conger]